MIATWDYSLYTTVTRCCMNVHVVNCGQVKSFETRDDRIVYVFIQFRLAYVCPVCYCLRSFFDDVQSTNATS